MAVLCQFGPSTSRSFWLLPCQRRDLASACGGSSRTLQPRRLPLNTAIRHREGNSSPEGPGSTELICGIWSTRFNGLRVGQLVATCIDRPPILRQAWENSPKRRHSSAAMTMNGLRHRSRCDVPASRREQIEPASCRLQSPLILLFRMMVMMCPERS